MQIAKNIKMLTIDNMHPILLWDENSLALIDTGYPRHTNELIKAIADAGFDARNLTHIILTHQDIDHVGCVSRLLEIAPNARVYAHELEAPYMDGSKTPIKLAKAIKNRPSQTPEQQTETDNYEKRFGEIHFPVHRRLKDGDVIDVAGGIIVVHTPGHSPGHICLYLKAAEALVLGDSAGVDNGGLTSFNPIWIEDVVLADKTLEEIIKPYPKKAVLGHHSGFAVV